MKKQRYRSLLLIILTAGSMTIGAKIGFPLAEVPLTLQTFFLCLTALYFRPYEALSGQLLYLLAGFFVPVFSGDFYGSDVLLGQSAGYLYAFAPTAWVISRYGKGRDLFATLSWCVVGHFLILAGGYLWLLLHEGKATEEAFYYGFLILLPGAFVKSGGATLFYWLGEKYIRSKK